MISEEFLFSVKTDAGDAVDELGKLNLEMVDLQKQQKALKAGIAEGGDAAEGYAKELVDVQQRMRENRSETRQLTKENDAQKGSLNQLRAELSRMVKERNNLDTSTEAGRRKQEKMNAAILEQTNKIKGVEEAGGDYRRNVGNYTESIKQAAGEMGGLNGLLGAQAGQLGSMATAFVSVRKGIVGATVASKGLKAALLSTGIGALVVALGSLVVFLTQTRRGSELLARVMKGVGAAFSVITDRISGFGETIINFVKTAFENPVETLKSFGQAIVDNVVNRFTAIIDLGGAIGRIIGSLLKGEFKAAGDAAKEAGTAFIQMQTGLDAEQQKAIADSIAGVVEEIKEETTAAYDLEGALQAVERREDKLIVSRAKARSEIAALVLESRNLNATFEERNAAINKAIVIQRKLGEEDIAQLEERVRILSEMQALGENSADDDRELANTQAELYTARKQADDQLRELVNRTNELASAEKGRINATLASDLELQKQRAEMQLAETGSITEQSRIRINLLNKELELKMAQLDAEQISEADKAQQRIFLAEATALKIADIEAEADDRMQKRRRAFIQERKAMRQDEIKGEALAQQKRERLDEEANQNMRDASAVMFGQLQDLLGENALFQKAVAIGQAVRNTFVGITSALASPFPFNTILPPVIGGLGFAQVAKIASSPPIGGGSGGGTGASLAGINTRQADIDRGNGDRVANSVRLLPSPVVRVTEINSAQDNLNVKVEQGTL